MKYRLTEKIGSGGMAEVFRAVGEGPEGFERPFVIKRIHPRLSEAPEFVRMFVDEAKISARLIHPNIVQVFEFAYQDGNYYIVMEPVDGLDMGWFRRRRPEHRQEAVPSTFVAEVGRQACRGLDFAHTLTGLDGKPLGIVHRDVTPPNLMVAWNGTVKVLDFGIARAVQALRTSNTDAGMVKGKMSYVAPELLDGVTADARSDVFSLGAVLHELLTGRQLFAGENDLETLKQVQSMTIKPPSEGNPGVKPALDSVVMRALERDPAKRYQSAGEMGDDLEALVLRKSYSTRALARKARELAQHEEKSPPPIAASPEGEIHIGEVASSVVADEAASRRRVPTAQMRTLRSDARRTVPRRWVWMAFGLPSLLAAALVWSLVSRPAAPPSADGAVSTAAEPLPATVRVALDSDPQGAAVTVAKVRNGEKLGETPLVLQLPRALVATELLLSKPGFIPLTFRVIPQQDKDVTARLEVAAPAPTVVVARPLAAIRRATTPTHVATPPPPRPQGTGAQATAAGRPITGRPVLPTPVKAAPAPVKTAAVVPAKTPTVAQVVTPSKPAPAATPAKVGAPAKPVAPAPAKPAAPGVVNPKTGALVPAAVQRR